MTAAFGGAFITEEIMIEKLAYSLGRNDEEPNTELAKNKNY
jgi:hypothetical protein